MKKKFLTNPFFEILLAITLLVVIALIMNFCTSDNDKDLAQTNEMLEYHSSPDQLTIERDGYVMIIKQ